MKLLMKLLMTLMLAIGSTPSSAAAAGASTPPVRPCPSECSCNEADRTVMCLRVSGEFNTYVKELPLWIYHLTLVCHPMMTSDGRPVPDGLALQAPRPDAFRDLLDIREISIRNCPISDVPDELFAYLPQLEGVVLEKLTYSTLPPNLFRGSFRLRQLWLLQAPSYTAQASQPLSGTAVDHMRLVGTGLSGGDFLNLVGPVAGRLRLLDVRSGSGPELKLPPGAFNSTSDLVDLNLSSNGIGDFRFLDGICAAKVTLAFNPVATGILSFAGMRPNWGPKSLGLSHMGLRRVPDGLGAFPALEELLLANNVITQLPAEMLQPLGKLSRLDLSSNQIRTLSSDLKPVLTSLLYRDRYGSLVYLADNPLHCNCELTWLFDTPVLHNNLPKDVLCASGGQFAGELLIRVQKHQLRCFPPTQPTIEVHIIGPELSSSSVRILSPASDQSAAGGDPVHEYQLSSGAAAELSCASSGDPAPSLRWLWDGGGGGGGRVLASGQADRLSGGTPTSRLRLRVDQARMPAQRMRLTCSASSLLPHQAGSNSTVALLSLAPIELLQPTGQPRPGGQLATGGKSAAGRLSSDFPTTGRLFLLLCAGAAAVRLTEGLGW